MLEQLAELGVPEAAFPSGVKHGQKSYTIHGTTGACIEVQVKNKLFRVQAYSDKETHTKDKTKYTSPNVRWATHGGAETAWGLVTKRCGW